MVAMQCLGGKMISRYGDNSLPPSAFGDLYKAMNLLYANNFVFADLRAQIILVEEDKTYAKLIDFDSVGEAGIDRYPGNINLRVIGSELSGDVRALGKMKVNHDKWALERVVERYRIK